MSVGVKVTDWPAVPRGGVVEGVVTRQSDKIREYKTGYVISTMPLTELIRRLDPPVPADVLDTAGQLRYRTHISVNLLVDGNPFPDNWIYVHSPEVRVGRDPLGPRASDVKLQTSGLLFTDPKRTDNGHNSRHHEQDA